MIILGLNGWSDGTHDPSAALVVDGKLVAFVEEERVNRKRHAVSDLPCGASQAVLRGYGVSLDDVDAVAYGWDLPHYYRLHHRSWTLTDGEFIRAVTGIEATRYPQLVWVPHHLAHASSAFYASGFANAAVLVTDGQGEADSVSIYQGAGQELRLVRSWPGRQSLGLFYEAATFFCGFGFLETGKTMGLSAYGMRPDGRVAGHGPAPLRWDGDDIDCPVRAGTEELAVRKYWLGYFEEQFGSPHLAAGSDDSYARFLRIPHHDPALYHPAAAAVAQHAVEQVMAGLASHALASTEQRALCLAGGVALNCVANAKLLDLCQDLYIQPAANDAGVSIGAAYLAAAERGATILPMASIKLGHSYSESELYQFLTDTCAFEPVLLDDVAEFAAERLIDGEVVGWFEGAMEGGPRALGGRSILALPADPGKKRQVNLAKGRELWRPLAPSILREDMGSVFSRDVTTPYMLLSLPMLDSAVGALPAVAHVDGSSRPQTVGAGQSGFRRLLESIKRETGIGAVLNTSFNGPGEPIVCTPLDAVRTFAGSGMDSLVLGGMAVSKKGKVRC